MKTLRYISIFCLLLYNGVGYAQFFNIINQRLHGTTNSQEIASIDTLNSTIYVGIYGGGNAIANYKTCTVFGDDAWVVAFDYNLNEVWQNCYGGNQSDYLVDLQSDKVNSNILIAVASPSGVSGNKTIPSFGGYDYWLLKTDAGGNIINQYVYGGSGEESFKKILLLDDGYLLCGSSDSPISGNKTTANRGFSDYWVMKIDFNGNKVWEKVFGGTGYDNLTGATFIPNTNKIVLYGRSDSPLGFEKTQNPFGYDDYWLLMIDTSGTVIWNKTIGTSESESALESLYFFKNTLFLVCSSNAPATGTKTCSNNGISDIWITKLDLNGNIQWDKCFGGDGSDWCTSAIVHNNQLWLGASSSSSISGHKTENSRGGIDYWLLAIDSSANILFQKTIGGSNWDSMHKLFFTSPNSVLMTGFSNSPVSGEKTIPPFGTEDLWFVQAELSVGVEENIYSSTYHIYPNPVGNYLHIENKNRILQQIIITDISGKQILKQNVEDNKEQIQISTESFVQGFYLLHLTDINNIKTVLKLVKN